MNTITGTIGVYLSPYSSLTVNDYDKSKNVEQFVYGKGYPTEYIKVGEAEISITFSQRAGVVADKVEALRDQLQEVRVNAQLQANQIEGEIQKLLSITNEVEA